MLSTTGSALPWKANSTVQEFLCRSTSVFGDDVAPLPVETAYPTLLEMPSPVLRVYPREAVVAEKFHAMVELGLANSRMKDFYDIWFLRAVFEFDGGLLGAALRATFATPQDRLADCPALRADLGLQKRPAEEDPVAGLRNESASAENAAPDLAQVNARLRAFLTPVLAALAQTTEASERGITGRGGQDLEMPKEPNAS